MWVRRKIADDADVLYDCYSFVVNKCSRIEGKYAIYSNQIELMVFDTFNEAQAKLQEIEDHIARNGQEVYHL